MTNSPTSQSADDAASLLSAADKGGEAGSRLSRSAAGVQRAYSLALAALIGAFFLAIVYLLPDAGAAVVWIFTGIYLAVMVVIVVVYLRARKATAPRLDLRLLVGTVATTALFLLGSLLSTVVESRTPLLWLPVTAVIMLPLVLSTFVRARRSDAA